MWLTTEEFNFVDALPATDVNGISTSFPCLPVNMAKYQSMVAIINCGLGSTYRIYAQYASTATITSGTTGNWCIGRYRYSGAGGASTPSSADLLSAYGALATTNSSSVLYSATTALAGTTPVTSTANATIYIELKADDLPAGYPYVAIVVSTAAQASPLAVHYVMKPRYPQNVMLPSAT